MKDVIKLVALVLALLTIQNTNADTNDAYAVHDMFQTVVTPKEFSATQSQHDQLPDIHTMPKLDKEALYLFYKEQFTEKHMITQKMIKFSKDHGLEPTWGQYTYHKYSDGLLEFDIFVQKDNDPKQKRQLHFFQDKDGKFYEQKIPPQGKRDLVKKWTVNPSGGRGQIEDYKNHIKWSGCISDIYSSKQNTLEYTETTNMKDGEHQYHYKADFSTNDTPYGKEIKFKATHISIVDGKSGKPIVTETVYKGDLFPLLKELGLYKGILRPMKTFKTIRD